MPDDDPLRPVGAPPPSGAAGDGTSPATRSGAGPGGGSLRRLGRGVGRVVLVALGALAAVFAVANRQRVEFSWLVGETRVAVDASGEVVGGVPLFVLLLAAFGLGLLLGVLLTWRRRGARARRRA